MDHRGSRERDSFFLDVMAVVGACIVLFTFAHSAPKPQAPVYTSSIPQVPTVVQPLPPIIPVTPPPTPLPVVHVAPTPAPVRRVMVAVAPKFVLGSYQQALINQDRAKAGLAPLNWSSCLGNIAQQQAISMAREGKIFHASGVNQDFGCGLGSRQTGENVGEWGSGINDIAINTLFMSSPDHRANILGPYHWVGTAWQVGPGNVGYIAVEFG